MFFKKEGKKLKIAGIICEYNPFHNGHLYHINKTKEALGVDAVVALMSGNFVQRGLPSSFTKYERAKIACEYGCDLVLELPVFSSIAPADIFAKNAVTILNKLNVIDCLSFGSEDGIDALSKAHEMMKANESKFDELIKKHLSSGLSFSRAYALSFNELTASDIMTKSNNILAYKYISALDETKSAMKPFAVQRHGPGYNDECDESGIASASHIRSLIYKGEDVSDLVPALPQEKIIDLEKYFSYIKSIFIREKNFKMYFEYDEDAVNYIKKYIYDAKSYNEFMDMVSRKNFSRSKINRFLLAMLLNIYKDSVSRDNEYDFIIPLCANEKGKKVLKEIKKHSDVNVISKYKDLDNLSKESKLDLEILINNDQIYYLMKGMDVKDAYKINLQSIEKTLKK